MTLEKSFDENDAVFDQGGFKIVISKHLEEKFQTLEIDYVNSFLGKGFTISEKGKRSSSCC